MTLCYFNNAVKFSCISLEKKLFTNHLINQSRKPSVLYPRNLELLTQTIRFLLVFFGCLFFLGLRSANILWMS